VWQRRKAAALPAALIVVAVAAGCTSADAPTRPAATPAVSAAPASSAATAPSAEAGPRTITILGAGDELLHPQVWAQGHADAEAAGRSGYYFDPIFAGVKPAIEGADVAICHMETPIAPSGGPYHGYPLFSVPPQIAQTMHDVGYDTCSTASNHTLDQGTAGIKRTLDALDAAGVKHTGSYRTEADSRLTDMLTVPPRRGGAAVRVAQLSYTFGFNGRQRPQPWVANQTDADDILAAAHVARQRGADIVVLSIHWGVEYAHTPNSGQRQLAAKLLASPDIDLILGCHEHVVQPIAHMDGKWVAYGMGNQLARHAQPVDANREGIMPEFTFTESANGKWAVTSAAYVPTWVDLSPSIRVIDLPAAIADPSTPAGERSVYQAAMARIKKHVDAMGANVPAISGDAPR
jgi:hypothetical protein